jgi:hypothetical protein
MTLFLYWFLKCPIVEPKKKLKSGKKKDVCVRAFEKLVDSGLQSG